MMPRYSSTLFCFLSSAARFLRVDALHADEDLGAAGFGRQGDKVLGLARQVNLHHERDLQAFFAQLDDFLEGLAPELFAGEIIVSEKIKRQAVVEIIAPHHGGDALGAALAHFAPLNVDDRAEAARKRTATRGVRGGEARVGEVLHGFRAGPRQRRVVDVDQILQVLGKAVERLQLAVEVIGEYTFPLAFDFAGNHRNTFVQQFLYVRLLSAEHVDRAAGVKAAHDHGDALGFELTRHVEGAGKLIGLHADQANQQVGARLLAPANDFVDGNFFGGFIEGRHDDGQGAEHSAFPYVFGQAVQNIEGVARQHSFPEADDVTVVVVLRGLDQDDVELIDGCQHSLPSLPSPPRLVSCCCVFYK